MHDDERLIQALRKALEEHHSCPFDVEDRSILKDMISVGKTFKKVFLFALATFLIVGTVFMIVHLSHSDAQGACWIGAIQWETSPKILVGASLSASVVAGWTLLTLS